MSAVGAFAIGFAAAIAIETLCLVWIFSCVSSPREPCPCCGETGRYHSFDRCPLCHAEPRGGP